MHKTFLLILLVLLIGCKERRDQVALEGDTSFDISIEKWPKKMAPNSKTQEIIKDWEAFNAFQIGFDAIYTIGNTEDLNLVLEDLIEKQKELEKSDYPEPFNEPQVKSRQKVLHTYILKTKGDLIYRIDTQKSVMQMIDAHNALLRHMNSITSNTLDLKSILEEDKE